METGQKRKIFIQETLPDMDLMQEDLSGMCLIGSKIKSFKLQEGRCRYLRAQDARLQDFPLIMFFAIRGTIRIVIGIIYRSGIPFLLRAIFPGVSLKRRWER